jgi:hypothetical protein
MKLSLFILLFCLSLGAWAQVTTSKPPGPGDELNSDIELSKQMDKFVLLIKQRATTHEKSKLDLANKDFLGISSFIFMEYALNPPKKDCCDPALFHLSPILKQLLTPDVIETLDVMTHSQEKFERFLIQKLKLKPENARINYETYRSILKKCGVG